MGEIIDKTKGKVEQAAGDLSGDKSLKREGVVDEIKGNIKSAAHKVEDAAKNVAEKVKEAFKTSKP